LIHIFLPSQAER